MDIKNNPVGRLHDILRDAYRHRDADVTQRVWESVLGTPVGDLGGLLKRLSDVISLKEQAKQALVDGIDGDQSLYLNPFLKIDQMFARLDLSGGWSNSRQFLDEATLNALAFGNHALTGKLGMRILTSEQAVDFIEKLDQLLRDCLDSNLPEALQKLFHNNLESLRQALISYKISGNQGLESELDRMIGSMSRHSSVLLDQKDEVSKGFMKSVFEIVGNINNSIQVAEATAKLAGPAVMALLPLFP